MGKSGGRPKVSHYAMTMIFTLVYHYQRKNKLTTWNAWQKLTESNKFPGIVKQLYKRFKNKDYYIGRMLDDKSVRDKFYTNNVKRRGKDKLLNYMFTKKKDFTRRKKRK